MKTPSSLAFIQQHECTTASLFPKYSVGYHILLWRACRQKDAELPSNGLLCWRPDCPTVLEHKLAAPRFCALLKKIIVAQLVIKLPAFYSTRRLTTVLSRYLILSWTRRNNSTPWYICVYDSFEYYPTIYA
jgi:hypothetical protein